jgi:hypothetical protein
MGVGGAIKPRGPVEVAVDRLDRGQPSEALSGEREHDDLVADRELLAERVPRLVELTVNNAVGAALPDRSIHT